ncbi:MAG: GNAT family N-acetyltransferase [Sphingobacteriales bacterium]|nr:GNAT family N-acetyltransferase [Sphingobacteriales bacterium]MBI3718060.1 GNAT family N-acetyltransferase [Sphingobacteriales bacterium]
MQTIKLPPLTLAIAVSEEERQQAIQLLQQSKLPAQDIDDDKLLYLLKEGNKVIGTAGLEIFEDYTLLRSVSVIEEEQGKGYGKLINNELESYAKESGINCLYLLTTTAKDFFDKQGYCVIKREETPEAIKQTAEFSSLCPSSAVVMKKRL